MNKEFNLDSILFNLQAIVDSTKLCIKNSEKIDYVKDYKENLFSLIDILDSVDLIQDELSKYMYKRELD